MTKNVFQGIRAHVSGSYRTETLHGKEFVVVPVVALVQGVIQGMSASGPELALAEEFGKFPDSWNGRPVVMSHPVTDKGVPISANSPAVLEKYQIGVLFNSQLDGGKLLQEAWIDKDRALALNTNSKEVFESLERGEMIEVSTGYFAEIEPSSGMYANQEYEAIQRSIVPDHLAFLALGTVGACSNQDGCGAQLAANASPDMKFTPVKDFRIDAPCCAKCAETGGNCQHDEAHMPKDNASMDSSTSSTDDTAGKKKKKKKSGPEAYQALTIANTIADGVLMSDAWNLVCDELQETYGSYTYLIGLTASMAIFQMWDAMSYEYDTYQVAYSVTADGQVTLGDNPQEVILMTKILPANEEELAANATGTGDKSMTTTSKTAGGDAPAPQANETKEPFSRTVNNEQGTLEVSFNEKGEPSGYKFLPKVQEKKPQTAEEFIAQAPVAFQEVLTQSLKLHNDKRTGLIAQIKACGRNKMSDDKLNAMSLEDLENIAALATATPTFEGRALPNTNASHDEDEIPAAPKVFEFKPATEKAA